jgi:hypothetical protein
MRFRLGAIPGNPEFKPEETGWTPLKEPGPYLMQIMAMPVAVVVGGLAAGLWLSLRPGSFSRYYIGSPGADPRAAMWLPVVIAVVCVAIIPVHELLHAVVHPRWGLSRSSVIGLWPSRGLFYAHYEAELRRDRFVLILLAPLLGISVLPFLGCVFCRIDSEWLAMASILNALLSCGDVLGVLIVVFQVPRKATVCNQGWRTWWKIPVAA